MTRSKLGKEQHNMTTGDCIYMSASSQGIMTAVHCVCQMNDRKQCHSMGIPAWEQKLPHEHKTWTCHSFDVFAAAAFLMKANTRRAAACDSSWPLSCSTATNHACTLGYGLKFKRLQYFS
mmetsp:Transcript_15459/g.27102  ORF Transcript_15459/g.27102 Transcript_15459/m.27102 type:complete len:120 (-) Transcript_15459:590-949(-)